MKEVRKKKPNGTHTHSQVTSHEIQYSNDAELRRYLHHYHEAGHTIYYLAWMRSLDQKPLIKYITPSELYIITGEQDGVNDRGEPLYIPIFPNLSSEMAKDIISKYEKLDPEDADHARHILLYFNAGKALAGFASEHIFLKKTGMYAKDIDEADILKLFFEAGEIYKNNPGTDIWNAVKYSEALYNQKTEDAKTPLVEIFTEVVEVLTDNWELVDFIALTLYKKKKLEGKYLDRVINWAYKRIKY